MKSPCENIKDKNYIDDTKYCFPLSDFQEDQKFIIYGRVSLIPPKVWNKNFKRNKPPPKLQKNMAYNSKQQVKVEVTI